jgi:hypothetical protein
LVEGDFSEGGWLRSELDLMKYITTQTGIEVEWSAGIEVREGHEVVRFRYEWKRKTDTWFEKEREKLEQEIRQYLGRQLINIVRDGSATVVRYARNGTEAMREALRGKTERDRTSSEDKVKYLELTSENLLKAIKKVKSYEKTPCAEESGQSGCCCCVGGCGIDDGIVRVMAGIEAYDKVRGYLTAAGAEFDETEDWAPAERKEYVKKEVRGMRCAVVHEVSLTDETKIEVWRTYRMAPNVVAVEKAEQVVALKG